MILAGFLLLAIGLVDVLRRFLPGRAFWIGSGIAAVLVLVAGILSGAALYAVLGIAAAALWVWLLPLNGRPRLLFWPAVLLAVVVVGAVALLPARPAAGLFVGRWLATPAGPIGMDLLMLAVGVFAVLLETGNVIVRAALMGEQAELPAEIAAEGPAPEAPAPGVLSGPGAPTVLDPGVPTSPEAADPRPASASAADPAFRGGRLIGPLERVLVLLLTLFAAYPLLAAMLAAKGIVRFPEISRDGASGARAEYFLVGSLVSWVVALGGALVLWWAAGLP
jgi:hypothetical protein